MKNHYVQFFIIAILCLAAVVGTAAAQAASDQYFAEQVKLSKPETGKTGVNRAENMTAPVNDDFSQAESLTLNNGTFIGLRNNMGASKEPDEPAHAGNQGGSSVWFNLTPSVTQTVRLKTTAAATDFDTTLAVYTGASLAGLKKVGYNDDCYATGCGTTSMVDLQLKAGTTYRIAIDGYFGDSGTATGAFMLVITSTNAPVSYDDIADAYDIGTYSIGAIAGTNNLATGEAGEPGHSNGSVNGGRSVWYRFQTLSSRAMTLEIVEDFKFEVAVYSSTVTNPTFAQLSKLDNGADHVGFNTDITSVNFFAESGKNYFIVIDRNAESSDENDTGNFQLRFFPTRLRYSMRLDKYDSYASVNVFRPSDRIWYGLATYDVDPAIGASYVKFGLGNDTPVPADYDGDALTNYATTRSQNGLKYWYILRQGSTTVYDNFQWGLDTDVEVTGDFDRDGRADPTVIRKVNGHLVWYVRQSSNLSARIFTFGINQDRPVIADFDGDGATDIAVVRSETGSLVWYVLRSNYGQYTQTDITQFGLGSDEPAVEDFDGDGKSDIAVFRPGTGTWFIMYSSNGQIDVKQFGQAGDRPQPADYNDDGKADIALFRPTTGQWHFLIGPNNVPEVISWGKPGDQAVSSMARFSMTEPDE